MNTLPELLTSLDKTSAELRKTGKMDSAEFFVRRREIIADATSARNVVMGATKELTTCRAMAQYSDFSVAEEGLVDAVVSNAIAHLSRNP